MDNYLFVFVIIYLTTTKQTNKARNDPMDTSFHLLLPLELNQNEVGEKEG